jgi:hypothetical protein
VLRIDPAPSSGPLGENAGSLESCSCVAMHHLVGL